MYLKVICSELQKFHRALEECDGDAVAEAALMEGLTALEVERDHKLSGIAGLIKSYEGEAEMFRAEIERLTERKRVLENRVKSLRSFVSFYLGGAAWKSPDGLHSFTYRRSVSCEPENEDATSEEFLKQLPAECYTVTVKPSVSSIKKILTEPGAVIPGWRLVEKSNLQVR